MQHNRLRFTNRFWSVVFVVALAACGSSDEVDNTPGGGRGGSSGSGAGGSGGGDCSTRTQCWDRCVCLGGNPDGCLTQCNNNPNCNNNQIDPGEMCDGSNLNNETCASATGGTQPNGTLLCSTSCTLIVSGCTGGNTGGGAGMGGGGGFGGGGP